MSWESLREIAKYLIGPTLLALVGGGVFSLKIGNLEAKFGECETVVEVLAPEHPIVKERKNGEKTDDKP